mmetsp:Transcript_50699/g.151718  ORF Transcript_50699/g.151718 Transcript_50699/m.151718 type:complete len:118 (+) Transcript_50699:59-412(+)
MVSGSSSSTLAKPGHPPPRAFWAALGSLLRRLRYLGLLGYALEWLLEASHASHQLHRWLHRLHSPKVQLLAITMVLAGHLAEHAHQEEENHHQEERLAAIEARLGVAHHPVEPKKDQ